MGTKAKQPNPSHRYVIQGRHQDEGWRQVDGVSFATLKSATRHASKLSANAIVNGMVRVVDSWTGEVGVTFGAGGGRAE